MCVCPLCYSRALSQSFFSCCRDLPVAVNHLNHEPELQPDDGDIHHHLGQDGCHSPGDYREGHGVRYIASGCLYGKVVECNLCHERAEASLGHTFFKRYVTHFISFCPKSVRVIIHHPLNSAADTVHLQYVTSTRFQCSEVKAQQVKGHCSL